MKTNIFLTSLAAFAALATLTPAANAGDTPEAAIAPAVDDSSFYFYADIWAIGIEGDVGVGDFSNPVDYSNDGFIFDVATSGPILTLGFTF